MRTGPVERMREFGTTIFSEMTGLAQRTGAINLGQGFPDRDGPQSLLEDAVAAIRGGANQYPPGAGVPALREAVAAHQKRWYGLDVDPETEVLVTAGATEALAATVLALCEPGDEVVIVEPWFDVYVADIRLAGAVPVPVPLRPPGFSLDLERLAAAFTPRTRMVLLNSPHNPTGAVLPPTDLATIAALAERHDAVVVTDEVYEHLTFDGVRHVPIATLPGMAGRTLTVSSAGKTFSVTGWKIGWVHGPAALVSSVRTVKQNLTYANGAPFQAPVASALHLPDQFFEELRSGYQRRRDILVAGLRGAGFDVSVPSGTYFVVADAAPLGYDDGLQLCLDLPESVGVAAIPVSALSSAPEYRSLVRFAYCKQDDVMREAARRLLGVPHR